MYHPESLIQRTCAGVMLCMLSLLTCTRAFSAEGSASPLNIQADRMILDDKKATGHYIGHVTLTQDKLIITADDIKVKMKNNQLDKIIIQGNPAKLSEDNPGKKSVKGQANRIEYLANSNLLKFFGNAQVNHGTQNIRGEYIQYDRNASRINANGDKDRQNRVNITITPKADKKAQ